MNLMFMEYFISEKKACKIKFSLFTGPTNQNRIPTFSGKCFPEAKVLRCYPGQAVL
jgi:hypothetical protein